MISFHTLKVVHTFIETTANHWNSYRLAKKLQFNRQTIQSSLGHLERRGWIEDLPENNGRFRHIYYLTEKGMSEAKPLIAELQFQSA